MLSKFFTKKSVTIPPISVGTNLPLSEPEFSFKISDFISLPIKVNCSYFLSIPSKLPFST